MKEQPNTARLKECLAYDDRTGEFYWLVRARGIRPNRPAGNTDKVSGYKRIRLDKQLYYAHHLAWLYATGDWPAKEIDHIDGNPGNNAISNLRLVTRRQQAMNLKTRANASGRRGVYWNGRDKRWYAQAVIDGKSKTIGSSVDIGVAKSLREQWEAKAYGDFRRKSDPPDSP